jgi:aspartyl-tRNA(Asn)/glutamyl-tRNA(Gln) amidotransferase subunit B
MVVGLEVHVELATRTKLFSASPNRFGDEPNTNIDPVTLGLPGALPVLNRQAVELAMRLGLALDCRVQRSTFARKNYFYPDMPKAYQISQYDEPICVDGWLDLPGSIRVGIERAHLEEDTGKSTHVGGSGGRIHGSDHSLIDFNRAGVPLVEIVSRPDIRTPDQAKAYVSELRAILVAVGASDAKMEEGSMRVDANVSVRRPVPSSARAARSRTSTRSARSAERSSTRRSGRSACSKPASRSARRPVTGTRTTAERTRCAARRTPTTTATSRSPISSSSIPIPEWIERVRARPADAAGGAASPSRRRHRAGTRCRGDPRRHRSRPGRLRVRRRRGRRRRRPGARPRQGGVRRAGGRPTVPAGDLARLTRLEVDGKLTATQAKQVLAEIVANGGGDAEAIARRRASRRWTPVRSSRWSTRRSPRSPMRGRSSAPAKAERWAPWSAPS